MSKCLRCGAGNEWIDPIGKDDAEIASLRQRVAAAESRAARLESALKTIMEQCDLHTDEANAEALAALRGEPPEAWKEGA